MFGSLVKQYQLGQDAADADWLIGADIVGPQLAPRTAVDEGAGHGQPVRQPALDDGRLRPHDVGQRGRPHQLRHPEPRLLPDRHGHRGNAWEAAGQIWYDTLADPRLHPTATFSRFAGLTLRSARTRFGSSSSEAAAVKSGWQAVKVKVR